MLTNLKNLIITFFQFNLKKEVTLFDQEFFLGNCNKNFWLKNFLIKLKLKPFIF